jgi:NitT/TauT family transport system ATP-binding protein
VVRGVSVVNQRVIECRDLSHWYGTKLVLHQVNIAIAPGQIVGLVGPSGCGKSTLLRAILGTHPPSDGKVVVYKSGDESGAIVSSPGRDRGIVYQRYALFPFLTSRENVAIGPKLDETSIPGRLFGFSKWRKLRKQHLEEADALLEKVGLTDSIHRYPHELSGGMRQRVAIAQALIMKPSILLLDEPFGALDEATREELQLLLLSLYAENCAAKAKGEDPLYTILIVTHELTEALYVGDRVLGLSQYWDWASQGLKKSPGATIIYDKAAPVYLPGQPKRYEEFVAQREEIRRVVFEPLEPSPPGEHLTFWEQVERGEVGGVLGV